MSWVVGMCAILSVVVTFSQLYTYHRITHALTILTIIREYRYSILFSLVMLVLWLFMLL